MIRFEFIFPCIPFGADIAEDTMLACLLILNRDVVGHLAEDSQVRKKRGESLRFLVPIELLKLSFRVHDSLGTTGVYGFHRMIKDFAQVPNSLLCVKVK